RMRNRPGPRLRSSVKSCVQISRAGRGSSRSSATSGWIEVLKRADRALELVIYYASALLMLALTGVILYAVIARYFFNAAPAWSDEVPRVLFLWGTYIGIALAARRDKSLKVTFLLERLPPLGRLWLEMFMHVSR